MGAGSFGSCYLAKYRGITVAVKEYHLNRTVDEKILKREVIHEATVLSRLGDHPGLPLLFGVSTVQQPYRLITQYHGEEKSLTLLKAFEKAPLVKSRVDKHNEKHFPSAFTSACNEISAQRH